MPEDAELASGYAAEQPLDIVDQRLEPAVAEARDLMPDQRVKPLVDVVARRELLAQTRKLASTWPEATIEPWAGVTSGAGKIVEAQPRPNPP